MPFHHPIKLEQVAELAVRFACGIAAYGSAYSRQDFTQRQLMACLILKAHLKTTYRGIVAVIEDDGQTRKALGMTATLPHFTTLQKFGTRSDTRQLVGAMLEKIERSTCRIRGRKAVVNAVTQLCQRTEI